LQVAETISALKEVIYFVKNHDRTRALFKQLEGLALLAPGGTRFKFVDTMAQRALQVKPSLQKLFLLPAMGEFRASLSGHNESQERRQSVYDRVKGNVLSDAFWEGVERVASITAPVAALVTKFDSQKGTVGSVYVRMLQLTNMFDRAANFKFLSTARCRELAVLVKKRWDYLHCTIHGVAALLSPHNWADKDNDWSSLRSCVHLYHTNFFGRRGFPRAPPGTNGSALLK
jgi:hypothetical protein